MSSSLKIYKVIILLSVLSFECEGKDTQNKMQEAWIYPGRVRKGINLKYSKTGNWADLWTLLSSEGFYSVGKLCVRGVFVLYEEPNFGVSRSGAFDVVSGILRCKMISESTKSIQPVGSMGQMSGSSITFFEKPQFGSVGYPTTFNQGSYFFNKMDQTHSAIMIGRVGWTLTLKGGQKFCIIPDFDPKAVRPVCLIRSFMPLLMLPDGQSMEFIKVTQGCKNIPDEDVHKIQDCMYFGKTPKESKGMNDYTFTEVWKGAFPPKLKGRSLGEGKGNEVCSNEEKKNLLFSLYKAAITGSMDSEVAVEWSKIGRNAWRLDLLDYIFTILMDAIDGSIITPNFFSRTREMFAQKLAIVWGNETIEEIDLPRGQQDYDSLLQYMETCTMTFSHRSPDDLLNTVIQKTWSETQTFRDFNEMINPEYERKPKLDIVTEIVWIAGSMVGHICHGIFMKSSPFWALYYNIFYSWYMLPVVPEWKKPTEGLNLIFGGLNHNVEYNKFAMFATMVMQGQSNLENLKRPQEIIDETKEEEGEGAESPSPSPDT